MKSLVNFLIYLILIGISADSVAQSTRDSESYREVGKLDVGINVTSIISSFSGNGSFLEPSDLPLFLRISQPNSAIRIGLGIESARNEFFDVISLTDRQSTEFNIYTKFGIEKTLQVQQRWEVYLGIDLIGRFLISKVTSIGSGVDVDLTKQTIGFGLSPFTGVRYALKPRLYLSTEANLTYLYNVTSNKQRSGGQISPFTPDRSSEAQDFFLHPPLSLYLNYTIN